ncbi:NagC family transcriptional regulator [Cryobacterium frigoriphilum]|uniref:NagC family transcriptional regulator n=1 Tax=Cryobacterium frigoriphilum TaxID=1259150 RepID=A0A4R9AA18_9MICO|nr:NagC family transcriptional regulator [Cryobacterium frigoriphilum]TFD54555.1 NagC family transcriptional regulator [Cryobacterium frigoriphilum]
MIEIKLGEATADEGAAALLKFTAKVDTGKVGVPQALIVITTGRYAYTRADGVRVIPLSVLGP